MRSKAWRSRAKQSFLSIIMTHQESIKASRQRKLVEDDKFDRHMRAARVRDIDSRKAVFDRQTEEGISRSESRKAIQSSIY